MMFFTLLIWCMGAHAAQMPTAQELLQESDRARGATASLEGLSWTAEVTSSENGETKTVEYTIKVRENNAIAEVTAPARQKGETILFNDRTLWFYKPGLKKPVSISARQKLMGQAANGDIASTNYARDYTPESMVENKTNGVNAWKLELKAKATNVTYERIRYWIAKDNKMAVRAEFLTVSGEVFKIATFQYGNSTAINGKKIPFVSEMRIEDSFNTKNVTTIRYKNPREQSHSPSIFNVNNLIK